MSYAELLKKYQGYSLSKLRKAAGSIFGKDVVKGLNKDKLAKMLAKYQSKNAKPPKRTPSTNPRTNKPRKISVPTSRAATREEILQMIREERVATPKKPKSKSKKPTNVAHQTKQNQPKRSALDELIHGITHPFGD